jgi:RNA polymerase sigma factor (sigma-70 family)
VLSPRAPRVGGFAELYGEHVATVYGYFGYRVTARGEAEDLTQLTFERALRAWPRFDPARASARTWLFAIARNLLIDHYRRRQPIPSGDLAQLERPGDPDAGLGLGLAADLELALQRRSERERELLALRFGGDLSGSEIAELTGLQVANVHQILSRALRRMRAELEAVEPRPRSSALGG